MERLNQDTSFSQLELNNLLNATSTLPPISSYLMVTPAVTKPRQLAPTVGLVSKGVTITGEAQRCMQYLAIGRVMINLQEEQIVHDLGETRKQDSLEEIEKSVVEEPVMEEPNLETAIARFVMARSRGNKGTIKGDAQTRGARGSDFIKLGKGKSCWPSVSSNPKQ